MSDPFPFPAPRAPGLPMWVVYEKPSDFPDGFIARLWFGMAPTERSVTGDTLPEVRRLIAERFDGACLTRAPQE